MATKNLPTKPVVKGLVLHQSFHADEAVCVWLFKRFGVKIYQFEKLFEFKNWKIRFLPHDEIPPQEELMETNEIAFGGGGGDYDEHNKNQKKLCAAILFARRLGLDEDPQLQPLLTYTKQNDTKGYRGFLDIKHQIQLMQKAKKSGEYILARICELLDLWFDYEQKPFFATKKEVEENAVVRKMNFKNKEVRVVSVASDREEAHKLCMNLFKPLFSVVKRSNGNCQIFFNQYFQKEVDLFKDVANLIIASELVRWHKEKAVAIAETGTLSSGIWHVTPGAFIMNGSKTVADMPPTRLTVTEIVNLIAIAVEKKFHPKHKTSCEKGVCLATKGQECPLKIAHLSQCTEVRASATVLAS